MSRNAARQASAPLLLVIDASADPIPGLAVALAELPPEQVVITRPSLLSTISRRRP
ncbi:hypothetical protein [Streptomyces sp. HUAS ZL42]|uniref:hypothetical protein n=1 Tax=Streptomyces sp. HUAS ZL42 TaxID=3231715 RepID=UPI00345ED379